MMNPMATLKNGGSPRVPSELLGGFFQIARTATLRRGQRRRAWPHVRLPGACHRAQLRLLPRRRSFSHVAAHGIAFHDPSVDHQR
jgi:hypothetical protein